MKKLLITVNDKRYEVEVEVLEDDDAAIIPQITRPVMTTRASEQQQTSKPKQNTGSGDPKVLAAPLNGVVLEIKVIPGQNVKQGDILIVLEAMKMKTNITAAADGKVKEVPVKVKDTIEQGQALVRFE